MSLRRAAEILALAVTLGPVGAGAAQPEIDRDGRRSAFVSPAGPDTLLLEWLDLSRVTTGVDWIARSETSSILKEAGIEAIWRRGDHREAGRRGEIRVILVDRLQVRSDSGRPILGAAPAELREHPFVWIHVRSVRTALGLSVTSPIQGLPAAARRDLGVALGRVVAHEVVHALAPSVHHGQELMSECFQTADLIGSRLRVGADVAAAVQTALRAGVSPSSARLAGGGVAPSGVGVSAGPGRERAARDLAP